MRETSKLNHQNVTFIPLDQIPSRIAEILTDKPLVVVSWHGIRIQHVIEFLKHHSFPNKLINLKGGMESFDDSSNPEEHGKNRKMVSVGG